MSRRRTSAILGVALAIGALGVGGCVDRRIFITSEPPGARVYLNDQDVGATPLEVGFTWFGAYDVRLHKPGYEPLVTTRKARAPLHEVPPFDLVALLIPGTKRTHLQWHFELEPENRDEDALLGRAAELRDTFEDEDDDPTPGTPGEPGADAPEAPAPRPEPADPESPE